MNRAFRAATVQGFNAGRLMPTRLDKSAESLELAPTSTWQANRAALRGPGGFDLFCV
jgi:hypothetical protein